jgi:NAD(P)-dependent dehydrogenase (short-subunit alcohol dehydrogenase family)
MNPSPGPGADRPDSLSGKVALVTGAASGIGRATARALVMRGAHVAVVDRSADALAALSAEPWASPEHVTVREFDLTDVADIPRLVESVLTSRGRIDILVNAAGVSGSREGAHDLFSTTLDVWQRVVTLNATAPMLLCQQVGRHMSERGEGGRIVNVTSSAAFRAASPPAYACSKAALGQLTRAAAANLGRYDINVNAVAPGVTRTPMFSLGDDDPERFEKAAREGPLANLLGRVSEPEDVAAVIVFLCLPESRQITGQTIHTSAGLVV